MSWRERMLNKWQRKRREVGRCESFLISYGRSSPRSRQAEAAKDHALAWMSFLRLQWHLAAWGKCYRPTLSSSLWPLGEEFTLCSTESQGSLPRLPQECRAMPGVWVVFTKQTPPYLDRNRLRILWVTLSPPGRKHLDRLLIQAEIWWTQMVVFGGKECFHKSSSWLGDWENGVEESNPTSWQGNK